MLHIDVIRNIKFSGPNIYEIMKSFTIFLTRLDCLKRKLKKSWLVKTNSLTLISNIPPT